MKTVKGLRKMKKSKSEEIEEAGIDYNLIYKKWYKKIPYLLSIPWYIFFSIISLYDVFIKDIISKYIGGYNGLFVDLVGKGYVGSRLFAVILWVAIIFFGYIIYIASAIIISQKIKIVSELEKINKRNVINKENND